MRFRRHHGPVLPLLGGALVLATISGIAPAAGQTKDPAPEAAPAAAGGEEAGASGEAKPAGDGSGGGQVTADLAFEAAGVNIAAQLENLGSFEKTALATALKERKLELDLSPHGKRIGEIHVVNLDVFGEEEGILTLINVFHITTREYVIRRESLLEPGDRWDDTVIQETRRRLTDYSVTALVVLAPVKNPKKGLVDLLIVTRDIWSLRTNSNYELAGRSALPIPGLGGRIVSLTLAPSENNLLGLRKQLAAVFALSLGQWSIGPRYIDPRVYGTRLRFGAQAQAIFSRESSDFEGSSSSLSLSYPLYSYRRDWGGSFSFSHRASPSRQFEGFDVRLYDNPDTVEVEAVPVIFDSFSIGGSASVTRSFGYDYKNNFSLGYTLSEVDNELRDDFVGDDTLREAFIRDVLPRSERVSAVSLGWSFFTPKFVTYRNIDTYSLAEDVQLGPSVGASVAVARQEIGSENNFTNLSISASYTLDIIGDGFARTTVSASSRVEPGDAKDNEFALSGRVVPPRIFGLFRLVGRFAYRSIIDNENNTFLFLGGSTGLRGYDVSTFRGDTRFIGNLELRSPPLRLWFLQVGGVTFWDVGHSVEAEAGDPFTAAQALSLKNNVGLGMRVLIPQFQPITFSFDLAYAIDPPPTGPRTRLIFFIGQAF